MVRLQWLNLWSNKEREVMALTNELQLSCVPGREL